MTHKLTSYSESFTQLFPYKMHLHIDVENAYTKKAQTILDNQCSRAPCCYICTPATLAGCFCRHRWSALSRFSESYLKITQSWVIKYYTNDKSLNVFLRYLSYYVQQHYCNLLREEHSVEMTHIR